MILGHATAAVTLGVCAHLWPGDEDRARTILDAALADGAEGGGRLTNVQVRALSSPC